MRCRNVTDDSHGFFTENALTLLNPTWNITRQGCGWRMSSRHENLSPLWTEEVCFILLKAFTSGDTYFAYTVWTSPPPPKHLEHSHKTGCCVCLLRPLLYQNNLHFPLVCTIRAITPPLTSSSR